MFGGGAVAKQAGIFGFGYNRVNYKFDQGQRWGRFTTGRQMEIKRTSMFREDVTDLATVSASKLKIYAPILTMSLGYCLTIFVEARSGLKFPGPPTFASGLYLQCLGIAFAFMTLSTWLCFHAAQRAQVAMVQLRTRRVRLPVPTQRQLDTARKILSTYEEQSVYDMFRLPFVMPNSGNTPPGSDDDVGGAKTKKTKEADKAGYAKGGLPGMAAKMKGKVKDIKEEAGGSKKEMAHSARIPGTTSGAPSWIQKELDSREDLPGASPSGHGMEAPSEPYEHFELIREAQKEYWCAEAYCRVTFLLGFMHMIQSFAYWLTLHCIAELGMVWCSIVVGISLTSAVWVMFRLDVLPDHGGCLPIEAAGPSVTSISLALAYTHAPTQSAIDISRAAAILIYLMHLAWTFRLYMIAQPANGAANHEARETGGRLFNQTASCETPTWLPAAFQHVSYLVAPPKTQSQLSQEQADRDHTQAADDPLVKVDMTPWYYVRTLLIFTFLGWVILLTGRIVEATMSERMLVTNPGAPPWSRVGQWYGWESGPISSKHYAHVTPQRGHFAWQRGWGPQGQQELWASDMFGFHPEADMHWAEDVGPEPLVGVAGKGENTWSEGVIKFGRKWEGASHDWLDSGGHRRLQSIVPGIVVPVATVDVQWPALFEPEFLACGPRGEVAAFGSSGMGAMIPVDVVEGGPSGRAAPFSLEGLLELGMARSVNWVNERILVSTGSGSIAACPIAAGQSSCSDLGLPKLPSYSDGKVTAAIEAQGEQPFRAAVALGSQILMHKLINSAWHVTAEVNLPLRVEGQTELPEIVHLMADHGRLLVTTSDGSVFQWRMQDGQTITEAEREAPAAGPRRQWRAGCVLPTGKVARLASKRSGGAWQPELLI